MELYFDGGFIMKKTGWVLSIVVMVFTIVAPVVSAAEDDDRELEKELIYTIMIDRYNNGDAEIDGQVDIHDPYAYHGGDFEGILLKLDDLQEIGVSTISLSPVMANAENGFHGYWIEDPYSLEEQFGTMDDFRELIDEAHNRNMKVVIEFVPNYIATTNPIATDPEKTDWITQHTLTEPSWIDNTVQLNLDNPEVEAYLIDVAEYWMKETNIDGFKLHAVDQSSISFLKNFTSHIKSLNPDFYLLGDILYSDEASKQILEQTELDALENRTLSEAMSNTFAAPDNLVSEIYETWENTENQHALLYMDDFYTERFTQTFSENKRNSLTAWTLALTYMYTTPGIPTLLQGSELPMYGVTPEESQRLVPFNSGEPELKEFHHRISSLREEFPVLQYGDFELVGSDGAMSVFKRTLDDESMFIAINNGSESAYVDVPDIESGMQLRGHLGDNLVRENENGDYRIGLARESTEVYSIEADQGINWLFIGFVVAVFILFIGAVIYLGRKQKKRGTS